MDLVCFENAIIVPRVRLCYVAREQMRVRLLARSRSAPSRPQIALHYSQQMPSQPKVPTSFGRASCGSIVPETLREREGLLHNQGSQARQL